MDPLTGALLGMLCLAGVCWVTRGILRFVKTRQQQGTNGEPTTLHKAITIADFGVKAPVFVVSLLAGSVPPDFDPAAVKGMLMSIGPDLVRIYNAAVANGFRPQKFKGLFSRWKSSTNSTQVNSAKMTKKKKKKKNDEGDDEAGAGSMEDGSEDPLPLAGLLGDADSGFFGGEPLKKLTARRRTSESKALAGILAVSASPGQGAARGQRTACRGR
jgi:hypothetical protein